MGKRTYTAGGSWSIHSYRDLDLVTRYREPWVERRSISYSFMGNV